MGDWKHAETEGLEDQVLVIFWRISSMWFSFTPQNVYDYNSTCSVFYDDSMRRSQSLWQTSLPPNGWTTPEPRSAIQKRFTPSTSSPSTQLARYHEKSQHYPQQWSHGNPTKGEQRLLLWRRIFQRGRCWNSSYLGSFASGFLSLSFIIIFRCTSISCTDDRISLTDGLNWRLAISHVWQFSHYLYRILCSGNDLSVWSPRTVWSFCILCNLRIFGRIFSLVVFWFELEQ